MDRISHRNELTSSEAATLLAVHPSTVKRWCNDGELDSELTPGGHRRIHIDSAMRFARERGIRTVLSPFHPFEPHVWQALRTVEDSGTFTDLHALALQWARLGEFERLEQLFLALGRSASVSFCGFCDGAVRGLLKAVGDEWQGGRMRVGDEHMVSQAITSVLLTLRREWIDARSGTPPRDASVAVVGTMEGNHHSIGALCVRLLLERLGWTVFFPGPDVPIDDFATIQKSREASLVCISLPPSGTAGDVVRATTGLGAVYDRSRPYTLAFGGARFGSSVPATDGPFRSVHFVQDCVSLREALERGLGRRDGTR